MPVPTFDRFIEPILRHLATCSDAVAAHEVHDAAAFALGLSEADKAEILPSGMQQVYRNRAGWAHDRLKRAGFSSSPRRGWWQLTKDGISYITKHPEPLSESEIDHITILGRYVKAKTEPASEMKGTAQIESMSNLEGTISPDDRLAQALEEMRASTASELLETIAQSTPRFFERLVLDLLHAMGYGASREDLKEVGKPGDGGIDGIISLDRLGLEKVYVQAKRWQGNVGREAVQAFYGALAGQRANKGVFITTSDYTAQALDFGKAIEKIVLINGDRLAYLLMDYGVGVSHRVIKIPKIDNDYFED